MNQRYKAAKSLGQNLHDFRYDDEFLEMTPQPKIARFFFSKDLSNYLILNYLFTKKEMKRKKEQCGFAALNFQGKASGAKKIPTLFTKIILYLQKPSLIITL